MSSHLEPSRETQEPGSLPLAARWPESTGSDKSPFSAGLAPGQPTQGPGSTWTTCSGSLAPGRLRFLPLPRPAAAAGGRGGQGHWSAESRGLEVRLSADSAARHGALTWPCSPQASHFASRPHSLVCRMEIRRKSTSLRSVPEGRKELIYVLGFPAGRAGTHQPSLVIIQSKPAGQIPAPRSVQKRLWPRPHRSGSATRTEAASCPTRGFKG